MNVSQKLLIMLFTGFMFVHIAHAAKRAARPEQRAVALPSAQAITQAAVATGGATQATTHAPANPQDIQTILSNLREVKKLQPQLSQMPQVVISEILTKINSSPEGLTIGQVRSTMNKYLRGSVAPARKNAVALPAQTVQPAQQTKTAQPAQAGAVTQ